METLTGSLIVFAVSAAFVIFAGIGLARFGDELAEVTGWGALWVGTLLVSVATSLPELTINITAVWLEDSPGLALGNIFGANMLNIAVLAVISLIFGVRQLFGGQGRDTLLLILLGIGLVALATFVGYSGDAKIGPTSLGGILLILLYIVGMRVVYKTGRRDEAEEDEGPKGKATRAWVGFLASALVVIIAGRYLAASADRIAELSGISASFIGVLLVALVTTLPEGSVSVTAAMRRSYGIVIGNVYGSCAFNVSIIFYSDLFSPQKPLLGQMEMPHFAAAAAAFLLMSLGCLVAKGVQAGDTGWTRGLTLVIPVIYVASLYIVFILG